MALQKSGARRQCSAVNTKGSSFTTVEPAFLLISAVSGEFSLLKRNCILFPVCLEPFAFGINRQALNHSLGMCAGKLVGTDCISAAEMQYLALLFLGITVYRPGQNHAHSVRDQALLVGWVHQILGHEGDERERYQLLKLWLLAQSRERNIKRMNVVCFPLSIRAEINQGDI